MDERTKLDKEVACKNMERKLSKKRKKTTGEYTINEGDHPVVIEEEQSKKMKTEKILSKKNKGTSDEEYETNGDNPDLAKSNLADSPLVKSNVDDDQGKNMKKKKTSKKSKHKEHNESKNNECEDDDQRKKMRKKKLTKESKLKEHNDTVKKMKTKKIPTKIKRVEDEEHETNDGDPYLAKSNVVDQPLVRNNDDQHFVKINESEDDDQGKQMKKKKLSHKSKSKENCELKSNEFEDEDQGKKMKKKKKLTEEDSNQGKMMKKKKKKLNHQSNSKENCEFNSNKSDPPLARVTEVIDQGKKMKKKKKAEAVTGEFLTPARDGTSKPKRVTFSDQVEVCCDGLVRGKRATPEEDEKIKAAVYDYIKSHCLGDEGLNMILNSTKYRRHVRGCWQEIREALPNRPLYYVYQRAHVLFESIKCKWTQEELEFIVKFHKQHGSDWRSIAEALGKSRNQVKDAWRRLKFSNVNKGHWSQEEYQTLFDLVNLDLRERAKEKYRKSMHGMLRDNICWEAIAHKLSTRSSSWCCKKWYEQLVSPMVANGEWSHTDDYRMLDALYTLDACNMEEVDWDNLVEDRSGDVCRKRWREMVHHIGEHVGKSFSEQVDILAKRFCPDLLEAREAFDAKPVIC